MPKDEMRVPEKPIGFCPHCGNTAPQEALASHCYDTPAYDTATGSPAEGVPCVYDIRTCGTCNDLLVYWSDLPMHDSEPDFRLVYPKPPKLHACVPESVRICYDEAALIQQTAPNAYAVMIRKGLQALCDDRGIQNAKLETRLRKLAEKGDIPGALAEMTTVLRRLGNAGAHDSAVKVTVLITGAMDDFFRVVIEYVYVAPHMLQEFKKRLEKLDFS